MEKQYVLITGGSGLLGSAIKEELNHNSSNYQYIFLSSKDCDLRDPNATDTLFQKYKPSVVIHACARVGGLYFNQSSNFMMLVDNLKINTNVLDSCKKYNVKRLVNILSTCIFGNNLTYPLTSNQMYHKQPDSSNQGYSESKRLLNTASKLLSNETGIEIVSLIPTNLVGKNDNYNLENSHVIPGLIAKTYNAKKNNSPLIIKGNGSALRTFLYANDLAKIILYFVNCTLDKPFNQLICSPNMDNEISIEKLVNKIVKEFDFEGPIIYDSSFSNGQHSKTTDSFELLEYIPNFIFTPLDIALKNTINYFIKNHNTIRK